MSNPVRVGHVGITVPNLALAVDWYREVFGWQLLMGPVVVSVDNPRVADQIRDVFRRESVAFRQAHMLDPSGVAVELFEFTEPRTSGRADFDYWRVGIFHICVVDPEIDDLAARVEEHGGRRRTEIREVFPGEPYRFCYCEDPFGNIVELGTHPHAEVFGGRSNY